MKKSFLLILLLLSYSAIAQWSTNSSVNNAIGDLPGEQVLSKIGLCSDGTIYIAFLSNVSGSYNVRLQKLDNQGNELWAHNGILISDHPTDTWTSDWDMTVDIDNHAILTFSDIRAGGDWQVYTYRISPTGSFIWGDDGIQLSYSGFNAAPKVISTASGNLIFAWASDNVIIMQKINSAGVKQWGTNGITLSSVNSLSWPQLMPVGSDDFILKYFDDEGSPLYPTRLVYAQRYNSSGTPVWSSPTLISNASGISSYTQIFSFINDGSDGFYIAWHDDRDNNLISSAFVQHVNASGEPQWTANGVELSTAGSYNHFYPQVVSNAGSSDIMIFWSEMSANQNQQGINGQKLSSAGVRLWGNNGMNFIPLTATSLTIEAARSATTDAVILYTEGSVNASSINAFRVSPAGDLVWTPAISTVSSAPSSKVHTEMSQFMNDQWIISWEDNRTDANDVYAQNLATDGSLGPYEILYGNIQGHVTLTGGSGNITQVVVSAGNNSTFPDPSGDYILQVQTGTYTVTGTLAGYYPDEVEGVVVLEDQSTTGVDLELIAVPTTGWISGTVELMDGNGDVTQTLITAGAVTTYPDSEGFYIMEVGVGTWNVTAELDGYTTQMHSNILVEPGETSSDVDFFLSLLPTTGFLYGTVNIEGDMADITLATVASGTFSIHPDNDGDYILELPVGTQEAIASHPYTINLSDSVIIEPGGSTQKNFNLLMLRRDLLVTCHDQFGDPLIGSEIEIAGPEGVYMELLESDTIIVEQVPYGYYSGTATYYGNNFGTSDTTIDQNNNRLDFMIVLGSTRGSAFEPLSITPNPVHPSGFINFNTDIALTGTLFVYDSQGRKYSENYIKPENQRNFPVILLFNNQKAVEGLYFLYLVSENGTYTGKILIRN